MLIAECLAGGGSLVLLDLGLPGSGLVRSCEWQDGLFDLAWSEQDPHCVVSAAGDGSLQLWDTTHPQVSTSPCCTPTESYDMKCCPATMNTHVGNEQYKQRLFHNM